MSRRALLSGSFAAAVALVTQGKAVAATPLTVKVIKDLAGKQLQFLVSSSLVVNVYIEYGKSKGTYSSKT